MSSENGGSPGGGPSDYRDKIRAAREAVNAAAAESEKLAATQTSKRQYAAASPHSAPPQAVTLDQQLGTQQNHSSSPNFPQGSTDPSDIRASSPDTPQRPYRPERNSWLNIGVIPGVSSSDHQHHQQHQQQQQTSPPLAGRNEVRSLADTESLYSQPGVGADGLGTFLASSSQDGRRSDGSSLGEIPDFPVPQYGELILSPSAYPPQSPIQSPPALNTSFARSREGPPTARRGGTESYYSHRSTISPIAEEPPQTGWTPKRTGTRRSIGTISEQSAEGSGDVRTFLEDGSDLDRVISPVSGDASPSVVRQASVGRAAKPSVTIVRNSSASNSRDISRKVSSTDTPTNTTDNTDMRQSAARASSNLGLGVESRYNPDVHSPMPNRLTGRSTTNLQPVVEEIIGGLQKGGAIPVDLGTPSSQSLRPPITPHEERMSTTSLTDLIRRATRARTNLERGKTASRIMINDYLSSSRERLGVEQDGAMIEKPQMQARDIAATGTAAAAGYGMAEEVHDMEDDQDTRPGTRSDNESLGKGEKKPRRCCGIPQWLFVLLLVLIVIIIAAAIIIPVELVVVPRQSANAAGADIASCPGSHPCQNGGKSVVFNDSCTCACVNGFSGTNCETVYDNNCAMDTTTVSPSDYGNLTFGRSIPPIIMNSASMFAVNLNATALAGAFSAADQRCNDENALVTFLSNNKRRRTASELQERDLSASSVSDLIIEPTTTATPSKARVEKFLQAVTSASLLLDDPSTASTPTTTGAPAASSAAPAGSSSNATSTTGVPSSSPTITGNGANATVNMFAEVAVLWILQETDINTAQTAHGMLSTLLNTEPFNATTLTVVNGVTIDFADATISVPGISVGTGKGFN